MISAILLAAGESRRMGTLKQLLPFRNSTIIESCLDNLRATSIDELIIVLGHRAGEISNHISPLPTARNISQKIIINNQYRNGMTSSIQAGINSIDARAEAVVLALVDQPHVPAVVIQQLIEHFYQHRSLIVKPQFAGTAGHPIIIARQCFNEILQLNVDQGLNKVTRAHNVETLLVPVAVRAVIEDLDTPEDYALHRQ